MSEGHNPEPVSSVVRVGIWHGTAQIQLHRPSEQMGHNLEPVSSVERVGIWHGIAQTQLHLPSKMIERAENVGKLAILLVIVVEEEEKEGVRVQTQAEGTCLHKPYRLFLIQVVENLLKGKAHEHRTQAQHNTLSKKHLSLNQKPVGVNLLIKKLGGNLLNKRAQSHPMKVWANSPKDPIQDGGNPRCQQKWTLVRFIDKPINQQQKLLQFQIQENLCNKHQPTLGWANHLNRCLLGTPIRVWSSRHITSSQQSPILIGRNLVNKQTP